MRWLKPKAGRPARKKAASRRASWRASWRLGRGQPRWLRPALLGAAVAALVGGAVWLWPPGGVSTAATEARRAVIAYSARVGLVVSDVLLEGRRHTSRAALRKAVGLKRGDAMFGFDPQAMRDRLAALPWVREATVQRRLPGTVHVRIVERRPTALWQRGGRLALVDDEGVIITETNLGRYRSYLIVVGEDAPAHAASLIGLLAAEPGLARRVNAAVRVGKRRWNLELNGGIRVRLPEVDPHAAWLRLARLQRQYKLLARDVHTIDLRQPDRLIVETKSGRSPAVKATGGAAGRRT